MSEKTDVSNQPDVNAIRDTRAAGARSSAAWFPGPVARLIIAACLLAIVVVRLFDTRVQAVLPAFVDPAVMNLVTLVLGFIACVSLFSWFVLRSFYSRRTKRIVVGGLVGVGLLAVAALRLDGFNGDMAPRFAWRWTPRVDTQLAPVAGEPQEKRIDVMTTSAEDFPQFLGPDRNAYVSGPRLDRNWQAHAPQLLWKREIGAGWSAFSVVNGYAFTLEQRGPEELVTCYAVDSGELIWGHAIQARHETTLGGIGPRSTPTVHKGRVYAQGGTGVLRCLDGSTGQLLWQDDVLARVGLTQEEELSYVFWGRAASPLIVDDLVVVPGGGHPSAAHSLVAYRQSDGKVAWMGGERQIAYASPSLAVIGGKRQILIVNEDTVAGHDAETGVELWAFDWPGKSNASASASQAVAIGDDRVFVSKGYGGGCAVFEIRLEGGRWSTEEVWANRRLLRTKFANVVVLAGHAYGLSDGILECVELQSGVSQWKKGRYGNGQVLGVADVLLVVSEGGELAMVDATPDEFRELGRIQAIEGQTWNNLCLTGRRILVRNAKEAACYELPLSNAE